MSDAETTGPGAGDPAGYARACVERLVAGEPGARAAACDVPTTPAACFVTIKKGGALRGCIGTLGRSEATLGGEIARNAAAALHDPRFPSVRPNSRDSRYSVDVLGPSPSLRARRPRPHATASS